MTTDPSRRLYVVYGLKYCRGVIVKPETSPAGICMSMYPFTRKPPVPTMEFTCTGEVELYVMLNGLEELKVILEYCECVIFNN